MDVGRAISRTPTSEIMPAICSMRVKGSWMSIEQAQQATIGARNVMTMASARGRYRRESALDVSNAFVTAKQKHQAVTYSTFRIL